MIIVSRVRPDVTADGLGNIANLFGDFVAKMKSIPKDKTKLLNTLLSIGSNAMWTLFDVLKKAVFVIGGLAVELVVQLKLVFE
jgi:hypothetical protein